MNTATLKIEGMNCDSCAARIKSLVEKTPGVRQADVSYEEGEARIRYNAHTTSEGALSEIVEQAGFTVLGG